MKIKFTLFICHLLVLLHLNTAGQPVKSNPAFSAFSDIHIHASLKNYYRYTENPDSLVLYINNDTLTKNKYGNKNWLPFVKKLHDKKNGKESHMTNYDQANFFNLQELDSSVLCLSISPPEKILFRTKTQRWLNKNLVTHMSIRRQKVLADTCNSAFNEFMGEYYFVASQDSVRNNHKILLAKNNADLKRIVNEGNIGMLLTIEGGHALFGSKALGNIDSMKSKDCSAPCRLEIFDNIQKLHALPHRVFFITVAHFAWNKMFGNAKSLDKSGFRRGLLTVASFSDEFKQNLFAKYGDGIIGNVHSLQLTDTVVKRGAKHLRIKLPYSADEYQTDLGYQVINKLLDADNDFTRPIYIDCKHMDIKARFQYYEYIDSINIIRRAAGKKTIPIIASHIGLSGKKRQVAIATAQYPLSNSYEELIFGNTFYLVQMNKHDLYWRSYISLLKPADRSIYFEKGTLVDKTFNPFEGNVNLNILGWFYPWEINFCDDEIKYIYDSDGLIGLNLDSRILGFTMYQYNWRYKKQLKQKFTALYGSDNFTADDGTNISFNEYYQAEPLLRNIFRIIEVCGRNDATAWDHLAIGSDFDGFIQPVKLCPTAESIPLLHKKMQSFTKTFVRIHNQQKLLYGLSAETAMRKFFYSNGRDFMFHNFQD